MPVRIAAVLLDALGLYGALTLVIRILPEQIVRLGWAGPFIGLVIGWVYAAVCASHLCLGRSLGKLVMRIQLVEVAGGELPLGRAAARAAMLVVPLGLFIVSAYFAEKYYRPDDLVAVPWIQVFAPIVALGWLAANCFHAVFDTHGRTVYDRLVGSVVINTDPDLELLPEFLRGAREPLTGSAARKSNLAFAIVFGLALAMGSFNLAQFNGRIKAFTDEERTEILDTRRAYHVQGFGQPEAAPPQGQVMTDTKSTGSLEAAEAAFLYKMRRTFDAEDVKANADAMTVLDRVVQGYLDAANRNPKAFQDRLFSYLNEENKKRILRGEVPTSAPRQMRLEVTFAQQADLFFARKSIPVLSQARTVEIDPGDPATSKPVTIRPVVR